MRRRLSARRAFSSLEASAIERASPVNALANEVVTAPMMIPIRISVIEELDQREPGLARETGADPGHRRASCAWTNARARRAMASFSKPTPQRSSASRSAAIRVCSASAPCHQPKRAPVATQACWTSQRCATIRVRFLCARRKRRSRSARCGRGSSPARSRCAPPGSTKAGFRVESAGSCVALAATGTLVGAAGFGATGFGATGFGATGFGATGFGATRFGAIFTFGVAFGVSLGAVLGFGVALTLGAAVAFGSGFAGCAGRTLFAT